MKQYGMPADCRGWKQFLVERSCPADVGRPTNHFPIVVWVGKPGIPDHGKHTCWKVHPSSVAELRGIAVPAVGSDSVSWVVCEEQGRFIE